MIFEHSTYRSFLSSELSERRTGNPAYSLRAMAKNLGVSATTLSDVIAGKKNLSETTAAEISSKLKLTSRQKKYFCTLVQFEATNDNEFKSMLAAQLRVLNPHLCKHFEITVDRFNFIAEWYHTAILEMTHLDDFTMSADSVASALRITIPQAKEAIALLIRLGLLDVAGKDQYQKSAGRFQTQSEVPNEALRAYHYQMLSKAQESLRQQTLLEKFVGSETLPINASDLPKAKEIIENCFQQLIILAENSEARDHVYHLGIQFFKLTTGRKDAQA